MFDAAEFWKHQKQKAVQRGQKCDTIGIYEKINLD